MAEAIAGCETTKASDKWISDSEASCATSMSCNEVPHWAEPPIGRILKGMGIPWESALLPISRVDNWPKGLARRGELLDGQTGRPLAIAVARTHQVALRIH